MRGASIVLLFACSGSPPPSFVLPRNVEDLRARLLAGIPEGREIGGARSWMREHGFACEPPLPSATDAHASVCKVAGKTWTVVLIEKNGRLQDVQARP
ncbi:MAG: hypothetical protein E6J78_14880 [Deltaproteobacteria bacterium]|nr:MAG: hypothetical protein E6J78_14880 [Deltaproteobacteria bacterium]